jgi:methionyl-tRNA synthetase
MLTPETLVAKTSNLFPRQELDRDKTEADTAQSKKPKKTQQTAKKTESNTQNSSESTEIEFSDFQRLDLRVGTVVQADAVPKADKLLKLLVDIGENEPRQIVAGLAQEFSPHDVQGRQVVVVANLKPRTMRGVLSQGMILAVHDAKGLRLLGPQDEVQPGSKVS